MMTRLTITVPEDLLASIRSAAKHDGRNVSEMVRVMLEVSLKEHQSDHWQRLMAERVVSDLKMIGGSKLNRKVQRGKAKTR